MARVSVKGRKSRYQTGRARYRAYQTTARAGKVTARRGYTTVPRTRGIYGIPGEMKYFASGIETAVIPSSASWTGCELDPPAAINCLFAPEQGTAINQLVGRKCQLLKIKLRGTIRIPSQTNQTAADEGANIRILMVQDQQTNSQQLNSEDVMEAPVFAHAYSAIHAYQSLESLGRFKVLKDQMFTIQPLSGVWDGTNIEQNGSTRTFKWSHTFKTPVTVQFNKISIGLIADIVDHTFHIIANCDEVSLAPTLSYECRCSFKDV